MGWRDAPVVGGQQAAAAGQQTRAAWEDAPIVDGQPEEAPAQARQAGARSAAAAPGAQAPRADAAVRERDPSRMLREAGVSDKEAPFGAQFRFGLGAPTAESPEQRAELARRTLAPGAEVQVEPNSERVIFRLPGEQQFRVFNEPGMSPGDITRFAPEAGVLGSGVGAGVAGGAAGALGGPFLGGTGVVAGEGVGEGMAEYVRLMEAASQGLIDLTHDEIVDRAQRRGGVAALSTAAGGALLSGIRQVLLRRWGADAAVVDAMGDRPVTEALEQARRVRGDVQERTGQDLPLTTGQQTQVPEILRAEQAARGTRGGAAALDPVKRRQEGVLEQMQERAFGVPVTQEQRRELGGAIAQSRRGEARQAEQQLGAAEQGAFGTSRPPEAGIARAREQVASGREQVFEPLRQQFDQLQRESGIQIDLAPVRQEAKRLRTEEGQSILRSVSLQEQSRLLREAEQVGRRAPREGEVDTEMGLLPLTEEGQPDWMKWLQGEDEFEPKSLGEVQRTLRDVRRELRRPGMADEPQRERILLRVRDSLEDARNASLDEDSLARVQQLEQQYAQAADQLDRGIVGDIMDVDPTTGRARLSGQQAIDTLLRSPQDSAEFVRALGVLPNNRQALYEVQNGVTGLLKERFQDESTGMISPTKLRSFLNNRSNRESMRALFNDRPEVLESLGSARDAAKKFNNITKGLESTRSRAEKILGVDTADPARLATQIIRDESPQAATRIRNVLPGDAKKLFDRTLATDIRDGLLDNQGRIDAGKIDGFLASDRAHVARAVLGNRFTKDLEVVRDAIRLVTTEGSGEAPGDLAQAFTRDTKPLEGLWRFVRVPLGVMTPRSRAAVAAMGVAQDRTQQRLAEVLADPSKLRDLSKLASLSTRGRRAELILGRLGFGAYLNAKEQFDSEATSNDTGETSP